jgi:hypothetical protein
MQAGVGPGAEALGVDRPDLALLCGGVDALLRHGLRPRAPRDGWAGLLPGARTAHGPWDMLQARARVPLPPVAPSLFLPGYPPGGASAQMKC